MGRPSTPAQGHEHPPPADSLPRSLPRLTALRAPAALLVFGFHVHHDTTWVGTSRLLGTGYVGVGLFFVLSGFVLIWSTPPGRTQRAFWARRLAKVYPSHLLFALLALALPLVLASPRTVGGTLANLTLTQAWFWPWQIVFSLDAVSWSLSCEAFFYLLAPWVIAAVHRDRAPARALVLLGAWWVAAAGAGLVLAWSDPGLLHRWGTRGDIVAYTSPLLRSGEFALGIGGAVLARSARLPRIPFSAALMATGIGYVAVDHAGWGQTASSTALAPLFAVLLLAAARADVDGRPGLLRHRWLIVAGELSFAFYLAHELVIMNLAPHLPDRPGAPGTVAAVGLSLGVATVIAWAVHRGWELPVQRRILRRALRPGGRFAHRADLPRR